MRVGPLPVREVFPHDRSVAFLAPQHPLRLLPLSMPMRFVKCTFDSDYFDEVASQELPDSSWSHEKRVIPTVASRRLELLMQEVAAELMHPGLNSEIVLEAASALVAVEMARYGRRLAENEVRRAVGSGLSPRQLRLIRERMEAAGDSGYPALGELAAICGISLGHLMRSFKASTGWSLHQFISDERMKAAKGMLVSEKFTSKEISARLGFGNPAYFTTAFRRSTGLTPKEFRKLHRALRIN